MVAYVFPVGFNMKCGRGRAIGAAEAYRKCLSHSLCPFKFFYFVIRFYGASFPLFLSLCSSPLCILTSSPFLLFSCALLFSATYLKTLTVQFAKTCCFVVSFLCNLFDVSIGRQFAISLALLVVFGVPEGLMFSFDGTGAVVRGSVDLSFFILL